MKNEPSKVDLPPVVMPSIEDLQRLDDSDSRSKTARNVRIVAAFQIAGGIMATALYVMMFGMIFTSIFNAIGYFFTFTVLSLSVCAGFLLWTGRSHAAHLSVVVQSVQIPFVFNPAFQYDIYSFFRVGIGLSPPKWALKFDLGLSRGVALLPGDESQFGLNFLALGIVIWLLLNLRTINDLSNESEPADET